MRPGLPPGQLYALVRWPTRSPGYWLTERTIEEQHSIALGRAPKPRLNRASKTGQSAASSPQDREVRRNNLANDLCPGCCHNNLRPAVLGELALQHATLAIRCFFSSSFQGSSSQTPRVLAKFRPLAEKLPGRWFQMLVVCDVRQRKDTALLLSGFVTFALMALQYQEQLPHQDSYSWKRFQAARYQDLSFGPSAIRSKGGLESLDTRASARL